MTAGGGRAAEAGAEAEDAATTATGRTPTGTSRAGATTTSTSSSRALSPHLVNRPSPNPLRTGRGRTEAAGADLNEAGKGEEVVAAEEGRTPGRGGMVGAEGPTLRSCDSGLSLSARHFGITFQHGVTQRYQACLLYSTHCSLRCTGVPR